MILKTSLCSSRAKVQQAINFCTWVTYRTLLFQELLRAGKFFSRAIQPGGQMSAHVRTWLGGLLSGCLNQVVSHKLQTIKRASKSRCFRSVPLFR